MDAAPQRSVPPLPSILRHRRFRRRDPKCDGKGALYQRLATGRARRSCGCALVSQGRPSSWQPRGSDGKQRCAERTQRVETTRPYLTPAGIKAEVSHDRTWAALGAAMLPAERLPCPDRRNRRSRTTRVSFPIEHFSTRVTVTVHHFGALHRPTAGEIRFLVSSETTTKQNVQRKRAGGHFASARCECPEAE